MSIAAITGCSGYIGLRLLEFMERNESISRVIGVDIKPARGEFKKLRLHCMDIRDPKIADVFAEEKVDLVVHMAFVVDPIHDVVEMHSVDVDGTRNLLAATAACGAKHLTVTSSTTVFMPSPNNLELFTEDDEPQRHPTYTYASDKYDVEQLVKAFKGEHPDIKVAVVRPCMVCGPNLSNYVSRYFLRMPFITGVGKERAPMQFVHEDDVAEIFMKVVEQEAEGYFHAVGEGALGLDEIGRIVGKVVFSIPPKLLYPAIDLLWKLHFPLIEGSSGALDYMAYPWSASDEKTKQTLGLGPRRASKDVFRMMLESNGRRPRC
jgi:UDP-glucose 4-epimerase